MGFFLLVINLLGCVVCRICLFILVNNNSLISFCGLGCSVLCVRLMVVCGLEILVMVYCCWFSFVWMIVVFGCRLVMVFVVFMLMVVWYVGWFCCV